MAYTMQLFVLSAIIVQCINLVLMLKNKSFEFKRTINP